MGQNELRKGELKLKILNAVSEDTISFADIFLALGKIETGFGASYSGMKRELRKMQRQRERTRREKNERHKFYSVICNLKNDGFIEGNNNNLLLTNLGLEKIKTLTKKLLLKKNYTKDSDEICFTVVAYDFPEKLRRYRDWFRPVLKNLNYKMIQKSFFIGNKKIPSALIKDLEFHDLVKYIQIFSVNRKGSLIDVLDDR